MPPRKNIANIGSYKHISPTIKVKNHSSDSMIQCHCPSFHSCSSMIFYTSGPPSHVINTAAFACSGCNAGAVFTKRPSWKVCSCSGSRSFLTKCCQEVQNQSPNLQTRLQLCTRILHQNFAILMECWFNLYKCDHLDHDIK